MKKNIDARGRLMRLAVAVLLLIYAWKQSSWVALGFSLFTFYEAAASWCILYQIIGKNSCKR